MRISGSTIGSFRRCPRIFYFEQVVGFCNAPPTLAGVTKELSRIDPVGFLPVPNGSGLYHPLAVPLWLRVLEITSGRGEPITRADLLAIRVMPATHRGTLVHAALERWFNGGHLDPLRNPIDAIAFEALPFLPPRNAPGITTESEFVLEIDGVAWNGRTDLETAEELFDHKTTKDKEYAKIVCEESGPVASPCLNDGRDDDTPTCLLCHDLQCALYSLKKMIARGVETLRIRWNYLITKWGKGLDGEPKIRCISRAGTITRARALAVVRNANNDARNAKTLAIHPSHLTVPFNPNGCRAFGGCDFEPICNLTSDQKLEALMSTAPMTLPPFPGSTPAPAITWGPHPDPATAAKGVVVSSDRAYMRDPSGNLYSCADGRTFLATQLPPELAAYALNAAPPPDPFANLPTLPGVPQSPAQASASTTTTEAPAVEQVAPRKRGRPKGSGKAGTAETPPTTAAPSLDALTAATNAAYLAANPEAAARISAQPGGAEAIAKLQATVQQGAYMNGSVDTPPPNMPPPPGGAPTTTAEIAEDSALRAALNVKEKLFLAAPHLRAIADIWEGKVTK